jgi:hypothetical protein
MPSAAPSPATDASAADTSAADAAARPTCRCGHDRAHHAVSVQPTYGFWAWLALLGGISGRPKQLTWRCRRCGAVVETSRDPQDLRAFR